MRNRGSEPNREAANEYDWPFAVRRVLDRNQDKRTFEIDENGMT